MAQLVGMKCVRCGEPVTSSLDGQFCPSCQSPVHNSCMQPNDEGSCPTCGAPKTITDAKDSGQVEHISGPRSKNNSLAADLANLAGLSSLQKTLSFHVPSEGEPPYDQQDISTHRSIVRLGKVAGVLGVFVAVGFFVMVLVVSTAPNDKSGRAISRLILFSIIVTVAIPVLAYFFGTSVGLLLAPSRFFNGPIGRKWLKIAGVKNIGTARSLCLVVLIGLVAIGAAIVFVVISASNEG